MKKIVLGLVFWGSLMSVSYAASDRFGNNRPEIPRSSFTVTEDAYIKISTSAHGIVLRTVVVTSATAGSWIQFFNSTSAVLGTAGATRLEIITNTLGDTGPFDMYFSSGLAYRKNGTAAILIKWDYISPADRTASFARPNFPE